MNMGEEGLASQMGEGMELKNFFAAARSFAQHAAMLERKAARKPEDIYGEEEDMRRMVHLLVDLDIRSWRIVLASEMKEVAIEKELKSFFRTNAKAHGLQREDAAEIIQGVASVVNILQQVRSGGEAIKKAA